MRSIILCSLILLFSLNCSYINVVRIMKSSSPSEDTAYVYGRFFMPVAEVGHVGLIIEALELAETGEQGSRHFIGLDKDGLFLGADKIQVFWLRPGKYKIRSSEYFDSKSPIYWDANYPLPDAKYMEPFIVKPGVAYYLGDFYGESRGWTGRVRWDITKIENNFDETTNEFKVQYGNLAGLPVEVLFE